MQNNITTYSKIVALKKKFFPGQLLPDKIAWILDEFFNNLHNVICIARDRTRDSLIQTKDIARDSLVRTKDVTRDALIQTKDLTRDSIIRSKDITCDTLIQTKDLTRDALIQTKDLTRDSIIRSKDITCDTLIQTKDLTRDALIQTKDITRDSLVRTKDVTRDTLIQTKDSSRNIFLRIKDNLAEVIRRKRYGNANKFKVLYFFIFIFDKIFYFFLFVYHLFLNLFETIILLKYQVKLESDQKAVKNIKKIISNSKNVQKRVKKYYNKDSTVVYPPIGIDRLSFDRSGDFWLSVNRLTPAKRIDMQVNAFNQMLDKKLVIVGSYDKVHSNYVSSIKKTAGSNIIFLSDLKEEDLLKLYASCRGFITTSKDEDFGMTVVEAMASGKPVIAPNEGGYVESVISGKTGILIDDVNVEKIISSVNKIELMIDNNDDKYRKECRKQSEKFSTDNFINGIIKNLSKKHKILIFHDYFRILGGAEKLVLTLAKHLNADIVTSELADNFILDKEFGAIKIIALGKTSVISNMLPNICRKRFELCDFSKKYDFFIFSGTFSIYAAKKHKTNLWYCHTPLRGLYDLKNEKHLQ